LVLVVLPLAIFDASNSHFVSAGYELAAMIVDPLGVTISSGDFRPSHSLTAEIFAKNGDFGNSGWRLLLSHKGRCF